MNRNEGIIIPNLEENTEPEQMEEKDFVLLHEAARLMNISSQTLTSICALYDFDQFRLRTRYVVIRKEQILKFLDEHHYCGKSNAEDNTAVFDYRGELNEDLTLFEKPHTEIPTLEKLSVFAEETGLNERRASRYCDLGIFRHYRINSTYKLSQEDADYNRLALNQMQFESTKRIALKPRKKRATKAEMAARAERRFVAR